MKLTLQILSNILLVLLVSACGSQCPEGAITYFTDLTSLPLPMDDSTISMSTTLEVRTFLGRKTVAFDEVISGAICNDEWSGTVYVTCNIEIPAWEEDAFFLRECPVTIDPDATVYVEAHRDRAYIRGCTCHE